MCQSRGATWRIWTQSAYLDTRYTKYAQTTTILSFYAATTSIYATKKCDIFKNSIATKDTSTPQRVCCSSATIYTSNPSFWAS